MTVPLLAPLLIALQGAAADADCPAHEVVESRVRSILHLAPEQTLTETFVVERRPPGLFVELRGEGAVVIGQRELPVEGSCDELAQAAAVVLSAWLTDVHPDFAGALPQPLVEEPEPPIEAPSEPPPKPEPAPVTPPIWRDAAPPARPRDPSPPRGFQLGAAFALDLTSGRLALGGSANLDYGYVNSGFGLAAFGLVTTVRSEVLGPGQVEWRRWPAGVGPRWRLAFDTVRVDLSAGPAMSWLRLAGTGFDENAAQSGVDWGAFGSVRAFLAQRLSPYLALNSQIYPGKSTAFVTGLAPEWPLPALSLTLLAGLHFAP